MPRLVKECQTLNQKVPGLTTLGSLAVSLSKTQLLPTALVNIQEVMSLPNMTEKLLTGTNTQ